MITISSKSGQRLARARAELNRFHDPEYRPEPGRFPAACAAVDEWDAAAKAVADELIAGRHHLVEGD